jgi:hypothetical protein
MKSTLSAIPIFKSYQSISNITMTNVQKNLKFIMSSQSKQIFFLKNYGQTTLIFMVNKEQFLDTVLCII